MSGYLTTFGADHLLAVLTNTDAALPNVYLALTIGPATGISVEGDEILEPPIDAGYSRVALENIGGTWTIADGTMSNAAPIQLPTPTGDWGVVNGWAVCTQAEGGDIIFAGSLEPSHNVVTGDVMEIPVGGLSLGFPVAQWDAP